MLLKHFQQSKKDLLNNKLTDIDNKYDNLAYQMQKVLDILKENGNEFQEIKHNYEDIKNGLVDINNAISKMDTVNFELSRIINEKKERILICGFYGADNLGDELMLKTLIEKLSQHNNIEIVVLIEYNSNYDLPSYPNVQYMHYLKSKFDYSIIADNFSKLIFGGGALIDDINYKKVFRNYISFADTLINLSIQFINRNKEVYLLGLSCSNSIHDLEYIKNLNFIFTHATYVSLRDENSLDYLKRLPINTEKVKIIHDIVLSNNLFTNIKHKKKNGIGLILICNDELKSFNESIVEFLLNKTSYDISLIPFYNYLENDIQMYKRIANKFNDKRIKVLDYSSDFEKVLSIIDSQEFIISERYHGALISIALNKKLLTLIFDSHSDYIFKMRYLKDKYYNDLMIENISTLSKAAMEQLLLSFIKLPNNDYFDKSFFIEAQKDLDSIAEKVLQGLY